MIGSFFLIIAKAHGTYDTRDRTVRSSDAEKDKPIVVDIQFSMECTSYKHDHNIPWRSCI